MTISQEEFRGAIREVADQVTERDVPPLSLPSGDLTRHQVRRLRASKHVLAPLAAAVAVIAVVVTSVILSSGSHAPQPSTAVPISLGPDGVPPYYLEIGGASSEAKTYAEIRSTTTGATIATVSPPGSFRGFYAITGAADYWTFVLAAYKGNVLLGGTLQFFLAQFNPHTGQVTLQLLPIASAPVGSLEGLALSPNGRELAIAELTRGAKRQPGAEVSVYSLATGQARVWQTEGLVFNNGAGLSWSNTDVLAFNFLGETGTRTPAGVWLLDTATPGGDIWSDSRLTVATHQPTGFVQAFNGVLTTDGTKIAMPVLHSVRGGYKYEFQVFSAATGKLLRMLLPQTSHFGQQNVIPEIVWTSATANVLVVSPPVGTPAFGVLRGDRFTPFPRTHGSLVEQLAF
jgi:hypothetical protein